MIKDRNPVTEKILNLTLEIICLLTGEDYMVVKKQSEHDTDASSAFESGGLCKTQIPITDYPLNLLTHKMRNANMILERTKELPMPTAEVTVRCEDIAVYLSMEEWEYFQAHKEHYKEVIRKNRQPIRSQGCENENPELTTKNGNDSELSVSDYQNPDEEIHPSTRADDPSDKYTPKRPPVHPYSQDCTAEDKRIMEDYKMEPGQWIFPYQCKEEEIPREIGTGLEVQHGGYPSPLTVPHYETKDGGYSHNVHMVNLMRGNSPSKSHRRSVTFPDINPTLHKELNVNVSTETEDSCTNIEGSNAQISQVNTSVVKYECTEWETECNNEFDTIDSQRTHSYLTSRSVPQAYFTDQPHVIYQKVPTGENPFPSVYCGKTFAPSSDLLDHQRIQARNKSFMCSDCGKCFKSKTGQIRHQVTHTKERPFLCSDCGKCFTRSSSLFVHQRSHSGAKPYVCSECGKGFTRKSSHRRHRSTHRNDRPFSCPECGKCFKDHTYLSKHRRTHKDNQDVSTKTNVGDIKPIFHFNVF